MKKKLNEYDVMHLWRKTTSKEVLDDEERSVIGQDQTGDELFLVPESESDGFGEWMADEYGYQDYDNIVDFQKVATITVKDFVKVIEIFNKEYEVK